MSMTESENKLFDNLMQHNSAYYGYELCKGEIKTILQGFEELKQYRAIGTVSEFRESKNFLEFLYNTIQPNEMENYLAMYNASDEKGE